MSAVRVIPPVALLLAGACLSSSRVASRLAPFPADSQSRALGPTFDSAAQAFGLTPLVDAHLPLGVEEIRYWAGGGIVAEQDFIRLVRSRNRVDGMMGLYWRAINPYSRPGSITMGAIVRYSLAGKCRSLVGYGSLEACQLRFRSRPDWLAIWNSLTSLGVSTLPDQSSLSQPGKIINDGSAITIEVRTGSLYRRYSYSNAIAYADPEDQRARSIAKAFRAASVLVPPSSNERRFRGRLDLSPGKSEFTACGSRIVWGIQMVPSSAKSPPASDSTAHALYYIDVHGQLAMPGLRWNLPYPEIVQVFTVDSVAPWQTTQC